VQTPGSDLPSAEMGTACFIVIMTTTYQQLRQYFTEQELDNATIITRHIQHNFPHMTYAEIYINLLVQMIAER
jgi:hypothetical protein